MKERDHICCHDSDLLQNKFTYSYTDHASRVANDPQDDQDDRASEEEANLLDLEEELNDLKSSEDHIAIED